MARTCSRRSLLSADGYGALGPFEKHPRQKTVEGHLPAETLQIRSFRARALLQTHLKRGAERAGRLVGFGFIRHAG